ncbi:hypothetical protein [Enemella sp. A6]|uniref:hypothetical protein n=1 Tax=Enemella sp. A6 TaxID=3440152 RepID=UPI003EB7BD58
MGQRLHRVHSTDLHRLPRPDGEAPWAAAADNHWGFCGVVVTVDRSLRGYGLISPAVNVPRDHPQAGGPITEGAAVLMELHTADIPVAPRNPIARHLLRGLAAHLVRQRVECLEAFGTRGPVSPTLPPVDWLEHEGFRIVRDSPTRPRLCLELGHTLRLPDLVGWWQRLWVPLTGPTNPEPAGRVSEPAGVARP